MPDILSEVLALPGLGWIALAAFVGGMVRGFSGFGTAMIFLPIAALFVSPIWAIMMLISMDIFGPLPILPRAMRDARKRDLALLVGVAAVFVPVGLWLLSIISPEAYRYIISAVALCLVACLIGGLRYRGVPGARLVSATGAIAGVSGGLAGVPGPPVVLLYMASSLPVVAVRANMLLFLFLIDWVLLGVIALRGELALTPLLIGVVLAIPNALGNLSGQAVFDPARAGLYRGVAYAIVTISALMGLPVWD